MTVVYLSPRGVVVCEDDKVLEVRKITDDPAEAAKKWESGESRKIAEELAGKYNASIYDGPAPLEILIKSGLFKDEEEYKEFIQKFGFEMTKIRIKKSYTPDKMIIQAAMFIEDLNEIINRIYERLCEWYGIYFPEFVEEVDNMKKFFEIVSEAKDRKEAAKLAGIKDREIGYDFGEEDIEVVREIAKIGKNLLELKQRVTEYIRKLMSENYPNLTAIAGPIIGAKLLTLAGGIENLATLPASTIQVLGAEKALFRHLTKGTKPPKHGVLFQHPMVNTLPKSLRGRMARTLAAKIAIAAKVDYFSKGKEKIYEKLKKELDERYKELKEEVRGGKK